MLDNLTKIDKGDVQMNTLEYALKKNPIISAIIDDKYVNKALKSNCNIVILIQSDICTLKEVVNKFKATDKIVLVHMDLIKGLKRDSSGIKYLANYIGVDGIVTTHANLIRVAKEFNLLTIQRVFILDTASIAEAVKLTKSARPDGIEILPGIAIPYIKDQLAPMATCPIIAAGLINTKEEIDNILKNGAKGISSSSYELWNY